MKPSGPPLPAPPHPAAVRRGIRVRGVVQGVGFRPFVYRLAAELHLGGHVGNDPDGVFIEVEGSPDAVAAFEQRLATDRPPLARIDTVETTNHPATGTASFAIVASPPTAGARTFVAPDIALCDDCRRELLDPGNRRFRYPFINCTNCGPRFSITRRLPYDRCHTTMAGFAMCAPCAAEYGDPTDRRFHAQPIACATCGPRLWFESGGSTIGGTDAALAAAQLAIAAGAVLAVKGLGGYHLACDARSTAAVAKLRRRKHRSEKPFAVMARDLEAARIIGVISDREADLLLSPAAPIVLVRRRARGPLTPLVAPGNPFVGVMLAYTPLHQLLFEPVSHDSNAAAPPDLLVMTSGNLSDEPICFADDDARDRLARLVDGWLVHDRPIHVPCDDSIVRVADDGEMPIRRSRGYAPLPLHLPFVAPAALAVGGELKNTFCIARGEHAWMSQHLGDMGSIATLAAFTRSVDQFATLYEIEPEWLAADTHPGYHTRRWAEERAAGEPVLVPHHHAHVAAVMAEHGVAPGDHVVGFAFDGTGYGDDGTIWGGEVLVASYAEAARVAHVRPVPLPGGDRTIRKPYRAALAHLRAAGIDWAPDLAPVRAASAEELQVLDRQFERGVQCVATSSMGRLFDAVSSLLDVRHHASYEAQAAIELETVATGRAGGIDGSPPGAARFHLAGGFGAADPAPLVRAIVADVRAGVAHDLIAAGFHLAIARYVHDTAVAVAEATGIRTVALSGGVFQNVLLLRLTKRALRASGFRVLTHRIVPPNDAGLALGQLAVACHRAARAASGVR